MKAFAIALCLSLFPSLAREGFASLKFEKITKEELKAMLDDSSVTVIDARIEKDWKTSDEKIKGAVWEDPDDVKKWAGKYSKDKTIVLYCA